MLWCFEDNRKRGLSNILATSTWCEQAWDGSSLAPLIRRWLSCANQSDRPTETKVGLQAPPNRICHSSFLAVPHMKWWVNFVPKSWKFLKYWLQCNPRTMWPASETDTSRPKQRKWCWHAPEWTPSSALLLVWKGNTSHTSLCSICCPSCWPRKMFSSFKQEEDS